MKQGELLRHLVDYHCRRHRELSSHSIWINRQTDRKSTIPRHSEIKKHLAKEICKQLGIPPP